MYCSRGKKKYWLNDELNTEKTDDNEDKGNDFPMQSYSIELELFIDFEETERDNNGTDGKLKDLPVLKYVYK